jgi:succinylglutamate desuccinylase
VLELTPTAKSELSLLLSTGIHGNETAPVEIVDLLLRALYRGDCPEVPRAGGARQSACAGAKQTLSGERH